MGAYFSARESADYYGVSEKTIRNWIAAGRLSAERSAGSFRIAQDDLDVLRSGSPHPPRTAENGSAEVRAEGSPHRAESAEASAVAELVTLVRDLQAQLVTTASTAAMWQERAGTLSDRLALAESRLAALEAPQDAAERPQEARGAPAPAEVVTASAPDEPIGAPWWRRWVVILYS